MIAVIINLILLNLTIGFLGRYVTKKQARRIADLELSNRKLVNDINSLHRNQSMIVSSFKELHRIIRRYDKGAKKLRTDIRSQT
jgi:hypothetical protein